MIPSYYMGYYMGYDYPVHSEYTSDFKGIAASLISVQPPEMEHWRIAWTKPSRSHGAQHTKEGLDAAERGMTEFREYMYNFVPYQICGEHEQQLSMLEVFLNT